MSDLRYRPEDSTALWSGPSSTSGAFSYILTHEDGSLVSSGSILKPLLPLGRLPSGQPYVLEVWEECHSWESPSRAVLYFDAKITPDVDVLQVKSAVIADIDLIFNLCEGPSQDIETWRCFGHIIQAVFF